MSNHLILPENYNSRLNVQETEKAINIIKNFFQTNLAFELDLSRVTAPLFIKKGTGINDDLNGIEKPVSFSISGLGGTEVEIVQSLAKWKRITLADLGYETGTGIYTDMNAIRPDDSLDNIHSVYVDQWDWEKIISEKDRNVGYLKNVVRKIYGIISRGEKFICHEFGSISPSLPEEITFIHTEELEERYPNLSAKEREYEITKAHGAVFIIGIGGPLKNSEYHDGRAPDYDDWITPTEKDFKGLNGDIFVYNEVLDIALELSSMGIRVSKESLRQQLKIRNAEARESLYFHQRLLNDDLPFSIGGGIGQSRLCMFYLRKAHIGEIQASIWSDEMHDNCLKNNIFLL